VEKEERDEKRSWENWGAPEEDQRETAEKPRKTEKRSVIPRTIRKILREKLEGTERRSRKD
jgi:hypothetical protein